MGRKRNQGKARRAAKAKAREDADKRKENNQMANLLEQSLSAQVQQLQIGEDEEKCTHGLFDLLISTDISQFMTAFYSSFRGVLKCGGRLLQERLIGARKATMDEFAEVWHDLSKMEMAISCFLSIGTQAMLDGNHKHARDFATFTRYFEQYIAAELKQTQALMNWPKIGETYIGDNHTLVKFYRRRISCSCLDEKYQEVKSITKMGFCYNRRCSSTPGRRVERSKAKYCSRCRCATYCSRECQEADWTKHKPNCDKRAAIKAKFVATQQNM